MTGRSPSRRVSLVLTSTVQVLAAAGCPAGADSGFSDVPAGHIFEAPITWLHTESITHGCDPPANTHFCPDETVTRGQMAAFVWRASGRPALSGNLTVAAGDIGRCALDTDDQVGLLLDEIFEDEDGADVIVAGHDNDYERFAPMAPDGTADGIERDAGSGVCH